MTRSAAIGAAIADELRAHQSVLDAADGPHTLTLIVKMGTDGRPYALLFRPEWESRLQQKRRASVLDTQMG